MKSFREEIKLLHMSKLYTPTWDISLSLKKKYAIKPMLFSISMKKMELPLERSFFVTFGSCEKIEVKRGHLVKK